MVEEQLKFLYTYSLPIPKKTKSGLTKTLFDALKTIAGMRHSPSCTGFGARLSRFKCTCHVGYAKEAITEYSNDTYVY